MKGHRFLPAICAFLCAAFFTSLPVNAAEVTLKILVGSKKDVPEKVQVKQDLPQRINTNDILDLAGLDLGYDIQSERYYVFKEIDLAPKQVLEINVKLRDVWVIPTEELDLLKKRTTELAALLTGNERYAADSGSLAEQIVKNVDVVTANQAENAMQPGVKVIQHISAYEANIIALERIKEALGELENMVLASGQDPGDLIGRVKDAPPVNHDIELPSDQYKTLIYKLSVSNPSATYTKPVDVSWELPSEITMQDVLDAAGLEKKADAKTGVVTVYTKVELGPGSNRVFQLKFRDKWNVNLQRVSNLRVLASNVLDRISTKEKFGTIETLISGLVSDMEKIEQEPIPKDFNDKYVAFFRDQTRRLDTVEVKLNRISAALKPIEKTSKMGFNAKPPSMKTTWMIIYIILGFLVFMSLLFFFRWYGGGKVDRMQGGG